MAPAAFLLMRHSCSPHPPPLSTPAARAAKARSSSTWQPLGSAWPRAVGCGKQGRRGRRLGMPASARWSRCACRAAHFMLAGAGARGPCWPAHSPGPDSLTPGGPCSPCAGGPSTQIPTPCSLREADRSPRACLSCLRFVLKQASASQQGQRTQAI